MLIKLLNVCPADELQFCDFVQTIDGFESFVTSSDVEWNKALQNSYRCSSETTLEWNPEKSIVSFFDASPFLEEEEIEKRLKESLAKVNIGDLTYYLLFPIKNLINTQAPNSWEK